MSLQADCVMDINIRTMETAYEFDFTCVYVVSVMYSSQRKLAKNMEGPVKTFGNHCLAVYFT